MRERARAPTPLQRIEELDDVDAMLGIVVPPHQQIELMVPALGAATRERGDMAVRHIGCGSGVLGHPVEGREQFVDRVHAALGHKRAEAGQRRVELIEAALDAEPGVASHDDVLQPDELRFEDRSVAIDSGLDPTRGQTAAQQRGQAGEDRAIVRRGRAPDGQNHQGIVHLHYRQDAALEPNARALGRAPVR